MSLKSKIEQNRKKKTIEAPLQLETTRTERIAAAKKKRLLQGKLGIRVFKNN